MSKGALIGGGTGFIGRALVKHLCQKGYNVTTISRMPGPKRITWHELEKNGIPDGTKHVVNLAGQNVLDPTRRWTPGFKQNVWNSRINTNIAITKAITAAPNVESVVFVTGVSAYRPPEIQGDKNKEYTECDAIEDFNFMSKLCVEMEKAAQLPKEVAERCRSTIVRTGVVVGRGGGMIDSIYLPFNMGLGGPMGTGNQILPWIHIDDLCSLIAYCLENQNCCGGALNGVAPEIVTNGEFSKTFASTMHRPCLFAVPEFVVRLLFGEDRSALLLTGAKIKPKRALELGFQYKYPTAKAACANILGKK